MSDPIDNPLVDPKTKRKGKRLANCTIKSVRNQAIREIGAIIVNISKNPTPSDEDRAFLIRAVEALGKEMRSDAEAKTEKQLMEAELGAQVSSKTKSNSKG